MRGYRRFRKYGPRAFPVTRTPPTKTEDTYSESKCSESVNSTMMDDDSPPSHTPHTSTQSVSKPSTPTSVTLTAIETQDPSRKLKDCIPEDQWVYTSSFSPRSTMEGNGFEDMDQSPRVYPVDMLRQIRFLNSFSRKRKHFEI